MGFIKEFKEFVSAVPSGKSSLHSLTMFLCQLSER